VTIAKRALMGVLWSSGSNYISQAVGMLSQAVLGRLILEQEYGLFATANSMIQFVFIISAFSFNIAMIQSAEDKDRLYPTAFVLSILLSAVSIVMTLIAAAGYSFFRALTQTEFAVILSLALVNILNLFGQHFDAILQRNFEFKKISAISLAMNLLNPLVAVALAFAGAGVWSIVAGQLSAGIVFLLGSYLFAGWKGSRNFSRDTAVWFLKLVGKYLGSRSLEVVFNELDRIVIKRMNNYEQVGIYDRANLAARYPSRIVNPAILNVALPVYSKAKVGEGRLSEAYTLVNFFLLRALIPFGLVFFLAPDAFMAGVFGERWLASAPVLKVLSLYAVLYPAVENVRVMLYSLGKPEDVAKGRMVQIVVYVPTLILLVNLYGIVGAAWAALAGIGVAFAVFIIRAKASVTFPILRTFVTPFVFAAMTIIVYEILPIPVPAGYVARLLLSSAVIFLIFGLCEAVFERNEILRHLKYLKNVLSEKEPTRKTDDE